jgi:crossover junction endodeoxyribonuclease RuvC
MIIAIDPGKSGGWAFLDTDGAITLRKMPQLKYKVGKVEKVATDWGAIREFFADFHGCDLTVWLEQVGGNVGKQQTGASMFSFGDNYGFMRGLCYGLGLRLEMVTPQRWQKDLAIPSGDGRKKLLKNEATRRYPNLKVTDATCDALLILDWAKRQVTP